jgi:uncharacterized protein YfcZ (UPF0381/DUF406 family)
MCIPTYTGQSVEFEVYWHQCLLVATNNRWSDQTLKVQIVGSLRGEAANQLRWLNSRGNYTLEDLRLVLARQFSVEESTDEAERKLMNYQQKKGQSYSHVCQELMDLFRKAHPSWTDLIVEEETVKKFGSVIREDEVRKELKRVFPKPSNVRQVVMHAERLLAAHESDKYSRRAELRQLSRPEDSSEEDEQPAMKKKKKGKFQGKGGNQIKAAGGNQKGENKTSQEQKSGGDHPKA